MNEMINEQLSLVLEEIEMIGDVYQRADIRIKLIGALSNLVLEPSSLTELSGKDSIKDDIIKEEKEAKKEKKASKKDSSKKSNKNKKEVATEIEDNQPIIFEEVETENTTAQAPIEETVTTEETAQVEDDQPKEIDLEGPSEEESLVIAYEDEEGNEHQLDITEAWKIVADEEGSEERMVLARDLTLYNLLPVYNTLDKLDHSSNKMMLAYYMQEYGLEGINEFIEGLTEGMFTDVYEFANNENLEGLIANIEEAATEE